MKNREKIKKTLQIWVESINPKYCITDIDNSCPYDDDEIDREMSYSITLNLDKAESGRSPYLVGRIMLWIEGGIILEWDYNIPQDPCISATWYSYICKSSDWGFFLLNLETYFPLFLEYTKIVNLRNGISKHDMSYDLYQGFLKMGYSVQSE